MHGLAARWQEPASRRVNETAQDEAGFTFAPTSCKRRRQRKWLTYGLLLALVWLWMPRTYPRWLRRDLQRAPDRPAIPLEQCPSSELEEHASGIVTVVTEPGANATHPIVALICRAQQQWREKVARQSKTLSEAVTEYKRRYKRLPPKGFDHWYRFAIDRQVKLVDAYDVIHEWLEPFWALSGSMLRDQLERYRDVIGNLILDVHFHKRKATIDVPRDSNKRYFGDRVKAYQALLPELARLVPGDTHVVIDQRDAPRFMVHRDTRALYLEAARAGRTLSWHEVPSEPVSWAAACPVNSRMARKVVDGLPADPAFLGTDVKRFTELCENPEWRHLHTFMLPKNSTSARTPRNTTLCRTDPWSFAEDCIDRWLPPLPVLGLSPLSVSPEIPTPIVEQWYKFWSNKPDTLAWHEKVHDKLLWRGTISGTSNQVGIPWQDGQRARLHMLAHGPNQESNMQFWRNGSFEEEAVSTADLARRYLDVSLTRRIYQCEPDCLLLEEWLDSHGVSRNVPMERFYDYKYLFDVDGNGWSGRFRGLMASNSLVFSASVLPQWFRDQIQPWYHYVPIRMDYKDIFDVMAFFAGDLNGVGDHDDLARQLASFGMTWAEEQWRPEDAAIFLARLLLELARLMADDRDAMSYKL